MNGYNIKGIYGMNGSGKSGIVTSVKILKSILTDSGYLNNPISHWKRFYGENSWFSCCMSL